MPQIVKIDVEGFELPLLRGSTDLLPNFSAVIIELNGSGKAFGHMDSDARESGNPKYWNPPIM